MDTGLKGRVAIVTGGGSNIGRCIAMTLGREGASVVIAEIDEEQGQKVADTIKAQGGQAMVIKTDATDLKSVENMVEKTVRELGRVDILVNNLGWDNFVLFQDTTPEFWDKIIALNFKSTLNCTKAVLGNMIERKYGRIINIASDAGRVGGYKESIYAGCKGAVIAFSKSVAQEVGRYGITVNMVCPGYTVPQNNSDIGKHSLWSKDTATGATLSSPETQAQALKGYPLRRLGKPEDIANAVVFLVSDNAASFITGQTLSVSGGYTML